MKTVPLSEIAADLPAHLKFAEQDPVLITDSGKVVGLLMGFNDSVDWWETLLLHHPQMIDRVNNARHNLQRGHALTIEQIRRKYD